MDSNVCRGVLGRGRRLVSKLLNLYNLKRLNLESFSKTFAEKSMNDVESVSLSIGPFPQEIRN